MLTSLSEHLFLVVVEVLSELSINDLQAAVGFTDGRLRVWQSHYTGVIGVACTFCMAGLIWGHL